MSPDHTTALILVDHGSRRTEANEVVANIAADLAADGRYVTVEPAHMELVEPSIATAVDRALSRGATSLVICPFFLTPGRHTSDDIPQLVAEALAGHPDIAVQITRPVGLHADIVDVVRRTIDDATPPAPATGRHTPG